MNEVNLGINGLFMKMRVGVGYVIYDNIFDEEILGLGYCVENEVIMGGVYG